MSLLRKFFTVSGLTIVSRVLGVAREAMLSHFLGACSEMDAFLIAFKFPSFFRRCFAEEGVHSIFVPYFVEFYARGKSKASLLFASKVFTLFTVTMLVFTIVVFIFADAFVALMAPGFLNDPEKFNLAVYFTKIIFPSITFVGISTVYSGILVSNKSFFPFALAPILVNCVLILSLIVYQDSVRAGSRISYGVVFAGIIQFVFLYLCVKSLGLPVPKITTLKLSYKTKDFLKKLIPVVVGAGVAQVNVFVDSLFGSFLPTGSISFIYFADRFIQFPLALFGISMATILLPEISEMMSMKGSAKSKIIQSDAIVFVLRLTIPSVVGLIILSDVLISVLYGHGRFSVTSVEATSQILQIFAIGIPAYVLSKIFVSVLFAQKNSTIPVYAAVISIVCNIVLNCLLIIPFGIMGIAVGTMVSGFVNAYILYRNTEEWFMFNKQFLGKIAKILGASLIMGLVIRYIPCSETKLSTEILNITLNLLIGGSVYIATLLLLKDEVALKLYRFLLRRQF